MYEKIMVPLDGSELAECVLPHVESLAKGCQTRSVVFVRVIEPSYLPSGGDYAFSERDRKSMEAAQVAAAEDYLKKLVARLKYNGVDLSWKVIQGNVAEALIDYADSSNADLIIMATHGRSGVSRWVWGSVADKLLRSACVPVLMVRAPGCYPGI